MSLNLICDHCDKFFITLNKKRKFCSGKCFHLNRAYTKDGKRKCKIHGIIDKLWGKHCALCAKEREARYPEKIKENRRKSYLKRREKVKLVAKKWREKNIDKIR